jgi:hypothetical protein
MVSSARSVRGSSLRTRHDHRSGERWPYVDPTGRGYTTVSWDNGGGLRRQLAYSEPALLHVREIAPFVAGKSGGGRSALLANLVLSWMSATGDSPKLSRSPEAFDSSHLMKKGPSNRARMVTASAPLDGHADAP